MESKTKHRILGFVVVAGLVVLAYPFIQGGSSNTIPKDQQVSMKAPPFPDQAIQVAASEEPVIATPQDIVSPSAESAVSSPIALSTEPAPEADVNIAAPAADAASAETNAPMASTNAPTPDEAPQQQPAAPAVNAINATSANTPAAPAAVENATPEVAPTSLSASNDEEAPAPVAATPEVTKPAKKITTSKLKTHKNAAPEFMSKLTTASAINANKRKPLDNNGLLKLKQAAYVIQLGSFKEKANALRLVNKLRAQGYRAFIQHTVVASGENTRVFVGPEHHQASARVLASELQNKMKLHGIVISYKPFTL